MTFSIVAHDQESGELGIAVQSKFLAAGAVVPWAKAGTGAIATQALANPMYGPRGLELLASGLSAAETIQRLISEDDGGVHRQVGIVDAQGRCATYTGEQCLPWAGGLSGAHYACQGNILVGEETVLAMAAAFEHTPGHLCDRLMAALAAGLEAGGDSRGQQSAALLVVCEGRGFSGFNDRFIDLRVDDHPQPIAELRRILHLQKLLSLPPDPEDILLVDHQVATELQALLGTTGDYHGALLGTYDAGTRSALQQFVERESLTARWLEDNRVDRNVLDVLRTKAQQS